MERQLSIREKILSLENEVKTLKEIISLALSKSLEKTVDEPLQETVE